MSAPVVLLALAVLFTVCIAAAGSGIVAWLLPARALSLAFAPVFGVSILGALLVLAATWLPARDMWWAVLVPVALLSLAACVHAVARGRLTLPRGRAGAASAGWLAVAVAPPFVASTWPFVSTGSGGPVNLYAQDAWFFYIPLADWLSESRSGELLEPGFSPATHQIAGIVPLGVRIGFEELLAAASNLGGVSEGRGLTPLLATLLVTLAASLYALMRMGLGLPRAVAAVAAGVGASSSTVLVPLLESSGPSTFALAAVPTGVWLASLAVGGSIRAGIAGGVLVAGVIAVYPEAIPALSLAVLIVVGIMAVRAIASRETGAASRRGLVALAAGVAVAVTVSPPATVRAREWIRYLANDARLGDSPDWGIDSSNALPWVIGVNQLFEARRQEMLGDGRMLVLYAFATLALAAVLVFFLAPGRLAAGRVWLGGLIASVLVVTAYAQWGSGCGYCFYRSLVYLGPLLVMAAAAGLVALSGGDRLRGWSRVGIPIAVGLVLGLGVARATISTVQTAAGSPALTSGSAWQLVDEIETRAAGRPVLIEGAESGYALTQSYFLSQGIQLIAEGGGLPVFDPDLNGALYGLGYGLESEDSYDPDYDLVVSRFGGVRTNRRTVARAGSMVVQERAPYDVAVTVPTYAVASERDPADAVPWLTVPLDLRIASPREALLDLRLVFAGPRHAEIIPRATSDGIELPTRAEVGARESLLCVRVPADGPFVDVQFDTGVAIDGAPYVPPDIDTPEPPRGIALVGVTAAPSRGAECRLPDGGGR